MIILKIIFLYFIEIAHTYDFPPTGTRLVLSKTVKEKDVGVTMNANMKVSEQCTIAASKGNQVQLERGSSAIECRTRNQVNPGSNPLCFRFEDWAFSFSPLTSQLTQLYK